MPRFPAPTHDEYIVWQKGTSGKAIAEDELFPKPFGPTELKETIEKARKKAQDMVDRNQCKEVAIKFHRAGLGALKDQGIPKLPDDIIINTKTPPTKTPPKTPTK